MNFPRTTNVMTWETYLNRELTSNELYILQNVKNEKAFNDLLDDLAIIADKKNLYIPALSELHGNCLFESLQLIGVIDNHDEFRKDVAFTMKTFKCLKHFFHDQTETLEELFTATNEIEFVLDKAQQELYKYTYDVMCMDLSNGFSWTRLPTQLVLMTISLLLNAKIHILSNSSNYQHTIYAVCSVEQRVPCEILDKVPCSEHKSSSNLTEIYLGHIGEVHYVPLCLKKEEQIYNTPKYSDARSAFYKWAEQVNRR